MPAVDQQIMLENYKKDLLEALYVRSFMYDPDEGFLLSSGQKSDMYIDVKRTVYSSTAMELIGYTFYQELKGAPIDAVGGLTLGADGIVYATALICTQHNKMLDAFVIRKEPKKHGTRKWIEGPVKKGADVIIMEDVVTTGGSAITAVERAIEEGLNVKGVIALIDREEGGRENITEKTGLKFKAVFTRSDLIELHKKESKEE
ncbi:MAG: orotate phosphoribosyltransferase [Thermodesulfobacteriota bacterium]